MDDQVISNRLSSEGVMKRKRTKRPRSASPLDLTMGSASYSAASGLSSNSFDVDTNSTGSVDVEEDMANCLILLARGRESSMVGSTGNPRSMEINPFECKTCNRCFSSFQALGGHRASHRKPKVVDHVRLDEKKPIIESSEIKKVISNSASNTNLSLQLSSSVGRKPKVHECSICGAEFGSGQALGGHMRRHRVVPVRTSTINNNNNNNNNNNSSTVETEAKKQRANLLSLDLNLPAPEDETYRESKFQFTPKEQVIVFSASPLVDCHY